MAEKTFKVLLVEENNKRVILVRDALVSDGALPSYQIVVVACVENALAVVDKGDVDLILLGVDLTNTGCIETVRLLHVRYPRVPVVVLTQEINRPFATQAMQAGARDCLGGDEVSAALLRRVAQYSIDRTRIQYHLDALRLQKEGESELMKLGAICGPANLTTTLKSLSSEPLMDARPKEFGDEVQHYGSLLDRLLDADDGDKENAIKEELHGLADRLGALNAGPRDVVELHKAALSWRLGGRFVTDTTASVEEGRLLLLQLMGYLVSYYRRLSWGRRIVSARNRNSSKRTISERREKD